MNDPISPQSFGGRATAIISRQAALSRYYSSPRICQNCGKTISVKGKSKIADTRKRKYCSRSCAAITTNKERKRDKSPRKCKRCGKIIPEGLRLRACKDCHQREKIKGYKLEEHRDRCKGYQSSRSSIQNHARHIYLGSKRQRVCFVCGYDRHVEICHVRAIAKFSGATKIEAVNAIENLVTLCPNHHWELDHGLIELEKLVQGGAKAARVAHTHEVRDSISLPATS